MSERLKLAGKVALITGGTSGIGFATAQLFNAEGAAVAIVGRDPEKLEIALKHLDQNCIGILADVSLVKDLERVMQVVKDRYTRLDILHANAGISQTPPIGKTDEDAFDHIINLNFKGVFFSVVKALPLLVNGASIILTGSAATEMGRLGDPLYAASKAAVRSLARTLAIDEELVAKRIRINVVSPGAVRTPLTKLAHESEEFERYVSDMVPMRRWGEANEIACGVLFLASSDSSYVTGSVLSIDGGLAQV